jgi:hypothetical protein
VQWAVFRGLLLPRWFDFQSADALWREQLQSQRCSMVLSLWVSAARRSCGRVLLSWFPRTPSTNRATTMCCGKILSRWEDGTVHPSSSVVFHEMSVTCSAPTPVFCDRLKPAL